MNAFKDQLGREVQLADIPKRIVSLVPSQTELLYHLGLETEVVGITKFCIRPDEWFRNKKRVGGTKNIDVAAIRELAPNLIIGNKEENTEEDIKALSEIAPVWMSDIYTIEDALEMIWSVGQLTGTADKAQQLIDDIGSGFEKLNQKVLSQRTVNGKVMYFIWYNPMMLAGKKTFIDDMLQRCGLVNIETRDRYPEASGSEKPDYLFLSSEPFPFNDSHVKELEKIYPEAKIIMVDGEMFSWYGSNLLKASEYFSGLLNEIALQQ